MKFSLVPFQSSKLPDRITGEFELEPTQINCTFLLNGTLDTILWPENRLVDVDDTSKFLPQKAHETENLWEHTCFELFIGTAGKPEYFELNVSPDGRWHCYSFDDERLNMRNSGMLRVSEVNLTNSLTEALLSVSLEHNLLASAMRPLKIGVAVILETKEQEHHYYALSHPTSKPDFHRRDSHELLSQLDAK